MPIDAAPAPAPRPGPRPSTSRQEIVQCAIRMLDRKGPEALTFRAMARELGITVGALSRYFKNLADLQDEVAASIMSGLRPLDAASKTGLREQLLRLGMATLEINLAHPYLVTIHGPASAAVVARHSHQCLKVLLDAGIDFDRAIAIYSMVGNLAYGWGAQNQSQKSPELQARIAKAYLDEIGEFAPQMARLLSATVNKTVFRRWLLLYIDGVLPGKTLSGKAF